MPAPDLHDLGSALRERLGNLPPTPKRRIVVEVDQDDLDDMPVGSALEVETIWSPDGKLRGHGSWLLTVVDIGGDE